jgi:hypothetical protein
MHSNIDLVQNHEQADIVNLPGNFPEMITEGSYTFRSGTPTDVAIDNAGYVYIAGWGTGAGAEDYWVAKLSSDCPTHRARNYNGPATGTDVVAGMVMDSDGRLVTGKAMDSEHPICT